MTAHNPTVESRKRTVTIGIPAHNEEKNIGNILDVLLSQKSIQYSLEGILVSCDGCTDGTAAIVRKYAESYPKITLIDDGLHLGKSERLNRFYHYVESDILVTFDADVLLDGDMVVENLVRAFSDDSIGLVGGRGEPMSPNGFWERVFVSWVNIWYDVRKGILGGNNIHNHEGCISALSRNFYKRVSIPNDIVSDDEYLYLSSKELGFQFVFVPDARVFYRCPTTLKEYVRQSQRFIYTKYQMEKYFLPIITTTQYPVPLWLKMKSLGYSFVRDPLFTLLALNIQVYVRLLNKITPEEYHNGIWEPIKSSK